MWALCVHMSLVEREPEGGWPPQTALEHDFHSKEAQNLIPRRAPTTATPGACARVQSIRIGANGDLESLGKSMGSTDRIVASNAKLAKYLMTIVAVIVVSVVILVALQASMLWRLSVSGEEALMVMQQHLSADVIDQTIAETTASVHNILATTQSAAHVGGEIETTSDRIVSALNSTAVVLERLAQVRANTRAPLLCAHTDDACVRWP